MRNRTERTGPRSRHFNRDRRGAPTRDQQADAEDRSTVRRPGSQRIAPAAAAPPGRVDRSRPVVRQPRQSPRSVPASRNSASRGQPTSVRQPRQSPRAGPASRNSASRSQPTSVRQPRQSPRAGPASRNSASRSQPATVRSRAAVRTPRTTTPRAGAQVVSPSPTYGVERRTARPARPASIPTARPGTVSRPTSGGVGARTYEPRLRGPTRAVPPVRSPAVPQRRATPRPASIPRRTSTPPPASQRSAPSGSAEPAPRTQRSSSPRAPRGSVPRRDMQR